MPVKIALFFIIALPCSNNLFSKLEDKLDIDKNSEIEI